MRRAYGMLGLGLSFLVGCAQTTYMSFGPDCEQAVAAALVAPRVGDVALSVGEATYFIPAGRLRAELDAMAAALRVTPYASGPLPDAPMAASLAEPKPPIVAHLKTEVLEMDGPEGVLHVRRTDWHLGVRGYTIGVMAGNEYKVAGTKVGERLDAAWKRLASAARDKCGIVTGEYDGHPERPLQAMRKDFGYRDSK